MLIGYEMFLLAAEELNFSRAAERAFVTPQCLSDHIKRLEAHHHGMPRRDAFESAQILGYVPQQSVVIPDDAVFGNGYDNRNHVSFNF